MTWKKSGQGRPHHASLMLAPTPYVPKKVNHDETDAHRTAELHRVPFSPTQILNQSGACQDLLPPRVLLTPIHHRHPTSAGRHNQITNPLPLEVKIAIQQAHRSSSPPFIHHKFTIGLSIRSLAQAHQEPVPLLTESSTSSPSSGPSSAP
ncbi:hypothetical protein H6P81_002915 [Aristolochia fimbriata]|uniref:Uncharacterized protein n=1 Tax=Aristolochia fimbriata TaxID=158543 RepID=A0AAV7FB26_ARIFI|nr:hypothetical protein H6P81_002915 [Aristolochia fimbriata]